MTDLGLCFFVSCREENGRAERDRVISLADSKLLQQLSRVYLFVPSWQEAPGAKNELAVRWLFDVCDRAGVSVYWCRQFWVTWPGIARENGNPVGHARSHFDSSWYAAAIRTIRTEADAMGRPCGGYLEPHGNALVKWMKLRENDMTASELCRMTCAVEDAVAVAGNLDFVYPVGGKKRNTDPPTYRYPLAFLSLGHDSMTTTMTYRATSVEQMESQGITPGPPPGRQWNPTDWGLWVRPKDSAPTMDPPRLTEEHVKAFDVPSIQATVPSVQRGTLYIHAADWCQVMEQWEAVSDGDA